MVTSPLRVCITQDYRFHNSPVVNLSFSSICKIKLKHFHFCLTGVRRSAFGHTLKGREITAEKIMCKLLTMVALTLFALILIRHTF